jgi:UrcA family protein
MKRQLLIVMSLFLGALCPTAQAEPETRGVDVRLSFAADASAQDIYGEIKRNAARACRTNPAYVHGRLDRERSCREEFVARAVVALDRDALTAWHLEHAGNNAPALAGDNAGGPASDSDRP